LLKQLQALLSAAIEQVKRRERDPMALVRRYYKIDSILVGRNIISPHAAMAKLRKITAFEEDAPRLAIEVIPMEQANANLRFTLLRKDWRKLSEQVRRDAKGICQICGAVSHPLECHESWTWDDEAEIQKLVDLLAICHSCHLVKHYSQHEWKGVDYTEAFQHLCRVNEWNKKQADRYVRRQLAVHEARMYKSYEVDLTFVEQFGYIPRPLYEVTHLGSARDDEIRPFAKRAHREARKNDWVAIFRSDHACFDLGTIEPCTESPDEAKLLISSFKQMRHCHGNLVGLYDSSVTEAKILADLTDSIARRKEIRSQRQDNGQR
jgi:hypothetical protein